MALRHERTESYLQDEPLGGEPEVSDFIPDSLKNENQAEKMEVGSGIPLVSANLATQARAGLSRAWRGLRKFLGPLFG